jgi:Prolyl oligopeptidase family
MRAKRLLPSCVRCLAAVSLAAYSAHHRVESIVAATSTHSSEPSPPARLHQETHHVGRPAGVSYPIPWCRFRSPIRTACSWTGRTRPFSTDGAYGVSLGAEFGATYLAWYERGGAKAICHVRGGGEYGGEWHLAGKRPTMPNSWFDFIACAQYLIDKKYTSPAHLAAASQFCCTSNTEQATAGTLRGGTGRGFEPASADLSRRVPGYTTGPQGHLCKEVTTA